MTLPAPSAPPSAAAAAPSALPSSAALALERASRAALEAAFVRGAAPALDALVGWEFRGLNHPGWARVAGIKKFVKGFYRSGDGRTMGYNCPAVQNAVDGRWRTTPSDAAPRRFGYYEVRPVDPTGRDNAYLHAVLLDYGRGGGPAWDLTRGIRDYLVQVEPANPDLYLGKAYYAVGPLRVHSNFFILERMRPAADAGARR